MKLVKRRVSCPYCKKLINSEAEKCIYCKRDVSFLAVTGFEENGYEFDSKNRKQGKRSIVLGTCLLYFSIILLFISIVSKSPVMLIISIISIVISRSVYYAGKFKAWFYRT